LKRSKSVYTRFKRDLSENGNERRRRKNDLTLIEVTSDANEHEHRLLALLLEGI
jgi:hypothetical protein